MTSCNIWDCPASMGPTKCDWTSLIDQVTDKTGKYCYCADGYMKKTTVDDQTWTETCVPCQKDESQVSDTDSSQSTHVRRTQSAAAIIMNDLVIKLFAFIGACAIIFHVVDCARKSVNPTTEFSRIEQEA